MDGRPRGDECRRRLGVDEPHHRAVGEGKRLAILDLGDRAFLRLGEFASEGRSGGEGSAKERLVAARRDPRVTCRRWNIGSPLYSIMFLFCSAVKMDSSQVFAQDNRGDRGVPRALARASHRGYAYMSVCGNRRRAIRDPVAQ